MYNLPLSDSPLRSLFELQDLLPYVQGLIAPSVEEFTKNSQNEIADNNNIAAIFGFANIFGVYPADDKLVLVRVDKDSSEILWVFN